MAENKKVTRITASDDAPKKVAKSASKSANTAKAKAVKAVKARKVAKADKQATAATEPSKNVFARIGGYFKGSWVELRQVRWPNRKATWALTIAVTLFSLFFMGLIVLLDMLFKWLFELIII